MTVNNGAVCKVPVSSDKINSNLWGWTGTAMAVAAAATAAAVLLVAAVIAGEGVQSRSSPEPALSPPSPPRYMGELFRLVLMLMDR